MEAMLVAFNDTFSNIRWRLEDLPDDYVEDWSNYDVVDGEEGDNGVVLISTKDGILLCKYINHGGDQEDYEFTPEGKIHFMERLVAAMKDYLETR